MPSGLTDHHGQVLRFLYIFSFIECRIPKPNQNVNNLHNVNTPYLFLGFTIKGEKRVFFQKDKCFLKGLLLSDEHFAGSREITRNERIEIDSTRN